MSLPSRPDLFATPGLSPADRRAAAQAVNREFGIAPRSPSQPLWLAGAVARMPEPLVDWKPRSPRYALDRAAALSSREGKAWLRTVDISAGGIKLRGEVPVAVGGRCLIRLAGLPADLWGHLRWKAGALSGFQFEQPMTRCDLFALLTRR